MGIKEFQTYLSLEKIIDAAMQLYRQTYHSEAKFAGIGPGRINLFGDHEEYNNGYVFTMATPLLTVAVGTPTDIDEIHVVTEESAAKEDKIFTRFYIPAKEKLTKGKPYWANYVKGVVAYFPYDVLGFNCAIVTTIPVGAGLGSSAALQMSICSLLEAICAIKLDMTTAKAFSRMMESASRPRLWRHSRRVNCKFSEVKRRQSQCLKLHEKLLCPATMEGHHNSMVKGILRSWENEEISFVNESTSFLIIDSKVRRGDQAEAEFAKRKNDCQIVSNFLNHTSLRDATNKKVEALKKQGVITKSVSHRAKHIIRENVRVFEGVHAAMKMDLDALGFLLTQSHLSLRSNYEITCEEVDYLVNVVTTIEGVYGGKMSGPGFGGCIVCLVRDENVGKIIAEVKETCSKFELDFYVFKPSAGARTLNLGKYKYPPGPSLFP